MNASQTQQTNLIEFYKALFAAQKDGFVSITLTNSDPEADYKALEFYNLPILKKHNLFIEYKVERFKDDTFKIALLLSHKPSGQFVKSESLLRRDKYQRPILADSADGFYVKRTLLEGLLGIASYNDAKEAYLFGPERGHKHIEKSYDSTADFIESKMFTHTGKTITKKIDRREFERMFLGMTSEEEAAMTFVVPEKRKLSWQDIKLYRRCKRCFYVEKKFGIKFNEFDNEKFALQNITDILLKKEMDQYRNEGKKHPVMDALQGVGLLRHKKLDIWRRSFDPEDRFAEYGNPFHDVWGNWVANGIVDDVWVNQHNEFIMIDYKSSINGKIYPEYEEQLEFYAWLFKKKNYPVSSIGYLLVYKPIKNRKSFDWQLTFEPRLIPIEIDDDWVGSAVADAIECLELNTLPDVGVSVINKKKKCNVCVYYEQRLEKTQKILGSDEL